MKKKIVLVGNSRSGKTTCVEYFRLGYYKDIRSDSIGPEFADLSKTSHQQLNCDLWATPGHSSQVYREHVQIYCKDADVAIITIDCTDADWQQSIRDWREFLLKHNPNIEKLKAPIILLLTKCDLIAERKIDHVSTLKMAEELKIASVCEISLTAKQAINVSSLKSAIATLLHLAGNNHETIYAYPHQDPGTCKMYIPYEGSLLEVKDVSPKREMPLLHARSSSAAEALPSPVQPNSPAATCQALQDFASINLGPPTTCADCNAMMIPTRKNQLYALCMMCQQKKKQAARK